MEINITLLVQLGLVLLLLGFLSRMLFAPMLAVFEERERRIDGARADAQRLQAQANADFAEVEEKTRASLMKARVVLHDAAHQSERERQAIIDDAKAQAKTLTNAAAMKIDAEVKVAQAALQNDVQEMARLIAAKFTQPGNSGTSRHTQSKMECSSV